MEKGDRGYLWHSDSPGCFRRLRFLHRSCQRDILNPNVCQMGSSRPSCNFQGIDLTRSPNQHNTGWSTTCWCVVWCIIFSMIIFPMSIHWSYRSLASWRVKGYHRKALTRFWRSRDVPTAWCEPLPRILRGQWFPLLWTRTSLKSSSNGLLLASDPLYLRAHSLDIG